MLRRICLMLTALVIMACMTSAWAADPKAAAKAPVKAAPAAPSKAVPKAAPKAAAVTKAAPRAPSAPLANWAGFFVSGDYRAHSGMASEVFDNGRRDVGAAFVAAGLKPENVVHFSPMDRLHASSPEKPEPLSPMSLLNQLSRVTTNVKGGCVFFLTSHGQPGMIVMGQGYLDPEGLDQLLDKTCETRPTVVLLSACFSGSFIAGLAAPNRMIMTAAREDRTSFGCGEEDVHTFFDGCVLESLSQATTFDVLADLTKACVARRETQMALTPPSEPQVSVGEQIMAQLPALKLTARPPEP